MTRIAYRGPLPPTSTRGVAWSRAELLDDLRMYGHIITDHDPQVTIGDAELLDGTPSVALVGPTCHRPVDAVITSCEWKARDYQRAVVLHNQPRGPWLRLPPPEHVGGPPLFFDSRIRRKNAAAVRVMSRTYPVVVVTDRPAWWADGQARTLPPTPEPWTIVQHFSTVLYPSGPGEPFGRVPGEIAAAGRVCVIVADVENTPGVVVNDLAEHRRLTGSRWREAQGLCRAKYEANADRRDGEMAKVDALMRLLGGDDG